MWLDNLTVQLSMFGLVHNNLHQLPNTTHLPPKAIIYTFILYITDSLIEIMQYHELFGG